MQKVYVLKCENNKYYVGKTSDINRRFQEHFYGTRASEWTKLHRPYEIVQVEDMVSEFDEMRKTLECMKKFGINNVRGAQWSNIYLTPEQCHDIERAMNPNSCYTCGEVGHFSKYCPNHRNRSSQNLETIQCYKCKNYGHYANSCNYRHNITFCERCGRDSHSTEKCYAKFDIDGRMLISCNRCGRDSHDINECYATYHIDGRILY